MPKNWPKNWKSGAIGIALGAWILGLTLWPRATSEGPSPPGEAKSTNERLYKSRLTEANFGLLGVQLFETNEGKRRWNIRAKFAELHRKENYAFLKEVDTDFFAEKTGNVINTKSDYGRSLVDKQRVELEGHVTIHSRHGYLFTMDKLTYLSENHSFHTEERVQMKGPKPQRPVMLIRGSGLRAEIDDEHFFLKRNVTAHKRLKNNEWLRIQSKTGEFFTQSQRAIFEGAVHSQMPAMTIDSERFELSVEKEMEKVAADGNVLLYHKDRVASAKHLEIELGGNRIVLEGSARIDSKGNQIRGKRILLFTDDDRIEVEEAEGDLTQ